MISIRPWPMTHTVLLILLTYGGKAFCDVYKLSMKEAEIKALSTSLTLEQLQAKILAAQESLAVQKSQQKAKVTLEGSYRYQTEVPELTLGPGHLSLGQHNNASIGPSLSYTLYDGGADHELATSLEHVLQSRSQQKDEQSAQIILSVRQVYAQLQGQMEELHLLDRMLQLTQARIKDITNRLILGASRLELLAARREEDQLRLKFAQAQTALANAITQLAGWIGKQDLPSPLIPFGVGGKRAEGLAQPNFVLELETMEQSISRLKTDATAPDPKHPSIQSLQSMQASLRAAAAAQEHEYTPTIKAFARSAYEYPNGPIAEQVWQNSIGISFSMPIYDAGIKAHAAAEKRAEAQAVAIQEEQAMRDLRELWLKTRTQVHGLEEQKTIAASSLGRAREEERMIQVNYKAGTATYLDVQRAQFQVMEAETSELRIRSQLIASLALLDYLASRSNNP